MGANPLHDADTHIRYIFSVPPPPPVPAALTGEQQGAEAAEQGGRPGVHLLRRGHCKVGGQPENLGGGGGQAGPEPPPWQKNPKFKKIK